MTNDPYHMHRRHDLERTRKVWGYNWQEVRQDPSPNGLEFQLNQDDSKSIPTSISLQAFEIRVSIAHPSINAFGWIMMLPNKFLNICDP